MKDDELTVEWERLCRQCGQCCFEKWVDEDGTIHPTRIACRFLDIHSRQCRVYHKRFEVGEGCIKLTPDIVETVQWLPADCGYVRHLGKSGPGSESSGPGSKVSGPRLKSRRLK